MDEYPWIRPVAMTATLPIFTPKAVSVLFTASMTVSDHWSDKFSRLSYRGKPLVKTIIQSYLCQSCAQSGVRTACVHRKHLLPDHIDGSERSAINQMMNLISNGSYELEVLGIADFLQITNERLFSEKILQRLFGERLTLVSNSTVEHRASSLFYVLDPTPSDVSGIGLVGGVILDGDTRLVLALDYVKADPERLETLLQVHADVVIASILNVIERYPFLRGTPVHVYIERNTSLAHAAYIANVLKRHFLRTSIDVVIEKEYSKDGRERIGIWTRQKCNLLHSAQLLLDMDKVSLAENVVRVDGFKHDDIFEGENEIREILRRQLADYRRTAKVDGKMTYSGKTRNNNDDLATAFILWLAWSCYSIEKEQF